MKTPRYIPKWFRDQIEEMAYQNAFGYAGIPDLACKSLYRLCWQVYWQGRTSGLNIGRGGSGEIVPGH